MRLFRKYSFWSIFASISIWFVAILLCLVFLYNCNRPQFFAVSMIDNSLAKELSERKGVVEWSQLTVDSLNVIHLSTNIDSASYFALKNKILREEMKSGRLMTAEQMSENITGYYDKLIDVLIALFIMFSFAGYFVIDNRFKKQYEDDKNNFAEKIKQMLMETLPFNINLVDGISTRVLDKQATKEEIEHLREEFNEIMKTCKDDIALLAEAYDELTEKAASKQNITDIESHSEIQKE